MGTQVAGETVMSLLVPVDFAGAGSKMVDCMPEGHPTEVVEFECGGAALELTITKQVGANTPIQNRLWSDARMLNHFYSLTVDGLPHDPGSADSAVRLEVAVPEFRQVSETKAGSLEWNGNLVVEYQVAVTADGQLVGGDAAGGAAGAAGPKWARFNEFVDLHANLLSSLTHLSKRELSRIPKPPPKTWSLGSSHKSDAFKNDRRSKLEAYMQALAADPLVRTNPFLMDFLQVEGGEPQVEAWGPAPEDNAEDDWM
jgi:hypothetical protein